MGIEDLVHCIAVKHVGLVEGEVLGGLVAHDGLDAVDGDGAGVGEIIDDDDLVATLEQLNDGVRADKPAPPVTRTQVSLGSSALDM